MLELINNQTKTRIHFETTKFPDGTSQVWKPYTDISNDVTIKWTWQKDESEVFHLCTLVDLIRKQHPNQFVNITLDVPYLPYARQDKEISNTTTFSLSTFAKIINTLQFDRVISFDVHSKKAKELIRNFESVKPFKFHIDTFSKFKPDYIFYPDSGAYLRYCGNGMTEIVFYGEKVRNQQTGKIESYKLLNLNYFPLEGKRVLIVDDLCDAGGTFIMAAEELLRKLKNYF